MWILIKSAIEYFGFLIIKFIAIVVILVTIAKILMGTGISVKSVHDAVKQDTKTFCEKNDIDGKIRQIKPETERVYNGLCSQAGSAVKQIVYGDQ